MNIVIPMAGSGERFRAAGYTAPKPFIDVDGMPMIERVIQNLACTDVRYTLIARREHQSFLEPLAQRYPLTIVWCAKPTRGAAETVLLARTQLNNEEPLLLANSDQLVELPMQSLADDMAARKLDGLILTFPEQGRDPKWSYARTNADGLVIETKEKQGISDDATVGIYLFAKGHDFVAGADAMIAADDRTNNEFYVCPVYNYLIRAGKRIGIHTIPAASMHGLGTPEDLKRYLDATTS